MYVIQVVGTEAIASINKRANFDTHIPAERCTWEQTYSDTANSYGINHVYYWPLGGAAAVRIDATAATDCELGYIGKSGRFVKIST